jgi:glycosyltransferase involved in cell wall biosynthesis
MPAHIGYLTYGLDRALTGIGRYSLELARALRTLPDAPELMLLSTERTDPHALWKSFKRQNLPLCRTLPGLMTVGNAVIALTAARQKLDLVHDPSGVTPFCFGAGGGRTVVTIHDVIPWSFPGVSTRLDTWIYRYWLPRVAPRMDAVITVSQASKQDIVRYLKIPPHKVHVVYLCANQAYKPLPAAVVADVRQRYQLPDAYLLYVGSYEPRKNLMRLLQAFARLKQPSLRHKLVIVGPRRHTASQIASKLAELGIEQNVILTDYIKEADLPAIYNGADLFVFPSLYEGFGLPPLEAMACGTPVITSNTSSLPEVVGDAALIVDPYDIDALAVMIKRALFDEDLRTDLRRRGMQRAAQFTWERTACETLEVYRHVLR